VRDFAYFGRAAITTQKTDAYPRERQFTLLDGVV
jgi:hypothetical protein